MLLNDVSNAVIYKGRPYRDDKCLLVTPVIDVEDKVKSFKGHPSSCLMVRLISISYALCYLDFNVFQTSKIQCSHEVPNHLQSASYIEV